MQLQRAGSGWASQFSLQDPGAGDSREVRGSSWRQEDGTAVQQRLSEFCALKVKCSVRWGMVRCEGHLKAWRWEWWRGSRKQVF